MIEPLSAPAILLLVILALLLTGVWPGWPHAKDWGYAPAALVAALLIVVVILAVLGRI